MLDANKTPLTHRVTALAAAYLDGIGCKPVETEVPVASGYVVDVGGIWSPTPTEIKRLGMSPAVKKRIGDVENVLRLVGHGPLAVIAEVKTTRPDFLGDRKWLLPPPAHLCCLAYPSSILKPDELPKGWYGLETSAEGTRIRKVHRPMNWPHPMHPGLLLDFVVAVAVRRDHRTRYAAARDWVRSYTAEEREEKKIYSAARLLGRLADWLQHKGWRAEGGLAEMLPDLDIKKLPVRSAEAVKYFEALRESMPKTE